MTAVAPAIDVPTQEHWSDDERRNVDVVSRFVGLLMNEHDYDTVRREFGDDDYVQHSPGIPDHIEGLVGYLESLTKRYPEYSYDVRHVHADGDYVVFHSHATIKAKHRGDDRKGFNIIDRWRIVDDEIAEHWDAIQPLDFSSRLLVLAVGGRRRNSNSIF